MDLNIPDTRQRALADRLRRGHHIVATEMAQEFGVSLDTIRRDILALAAAGIAHRVRGGAVPMAEPAAPLQERLSSKTPLSPALISAAIADIGDAKTLMIDGGTSTLALIEQLPFCADRLVMTPSPWVAIACQNHGIAVYLIGGSLRAQGGIATGEMTQDRLGQLAADIAILGACGLEATFGLSSDDADESRTKQAMHKAAARTIVLTDQRKIGRRARHQTLPLSAIDTVISDASAAQSRALSKAGCTVISC